MKETYAIDLPDPATGQAYFDLIPVDLNLFSTETRKLNAPNVRVSPVMAETIIDLPMRMQRSSRSAYIKDLGKRMTEKEFLTDTPVVVGLVTTNTSPDGLRRAAAYLLDGQHRLNGVITSCVTQMFDFVFRTFADMAEMRKYALTLDNGMKRNHHHRSGISELDLRLGVNTYEGAAFGKAVRAIMREGLDPTLPFTKEDERNSLRVADAEEFYLDAGKRLFNILRFGAANPDPKARPVSIDFMKEIREMKVFSPLLVWTSKNTQLIRDFMVPILYNEQTAIKPVQNVFIQMCREGLHVKESDFRAVMGVRPEPGYFQSGNKMQRRGMMATSICLERFRGSSRARKYTMSHLIRESLRTVDRVINLNGELSWPSPVPQGRARGTAA